MKKITARDAALKVLCEAEKSGAFVSDLLNMLLRAYEIEPREKALAATIIGGVMQNRIFIDYQLSVHYDKSIDMLSIEVLNILRIGAYQILFLSKVPVYSAVDEAVKQTRRFGQGAAAGLVNALLRKISQYKNKPFMPKGENRIKTLSVKYSIPAWIISLWENETGDGEAAAEGYATHPPICLRVNTLKTTADGLIERLGFGKTTFIEDAVVTDKFPNIAQSEAYKAGLFHVQDLASQICAGAVDARENMSVLDLCAAPGGKTFTMAQMMGNKGRIVACDANKSRTDMITDGAQRLGLDIIETVVNDATVHNENLGLFDRVLCDAPCSGFGVMRRKPEIRYKSQKSIEGLPKTQYKILCEAASHVKTGGRLIYSTCTFIPAENEEVTEKFLKEHSEFKKVPILNGEETEKTYYPHKDNTDGFYIAAFIRK